MSNAASAPTLSSDTTPEGESFFYNEEAPYEHPPTSILRHQNATTRLCHLLFSGKFSDIIVCVPDESNPEQVQVEIPAHRMVLAARSPVFMIMLASGKYRETSEHRIYLPPGVTRNMAQLFLYVLYSDDFSLVKPRDIPALAELGHMYQVESIIEFVQDIIDFAKSPMNVFDLLRIFPKISVYYEKLIQYAAEHAEEIFLCDAHIAADLDTFADVLSRESLASPETLVADAIVRYAAAHALKAEEFFKLYSNVRLAGLYTDIAFRQFIEPYFSPAEAAYLKRQLKIYYDTHPVFERKDCWDDRKRPAGPDMQLASFISLAQQLARPAIPLASVKYRPADADAFYATSSYPESQESKSSTREANWMHRLPPLPLNSSAPVMWRKHASPLFCVQFLNRRINARTLNTVWGEHIYDMFFNRLPTQVLTAISGRIPRGLMPYDHLCFLVDAAYTLNLRWEVEKNRKPLVRGALAKSEVAELLRYFYRAQAAQPRLYSFTSSVMNSDEQAALRKMLTAWEKHHQDCSSVSPSRPARSGKLAVLMDCTHDFDCEDDVGVSPADSALDMQSHKAAKGDLYDPPKDRRRPASPNTRIQINIRDRQNSFSEARPDSDSETTRRTIKRWACPNCQNVQDWSVVRCTAAGCNFDRPEYVILDWPYKWVCQIDGQENEASAHVCASCELPRAVDCEMMIPEGEEGRPYRFWKKFGRKPNLVVTKPKDDNRDAADSNDDPEHMVSATYPDAEQRQLREYLDNEKNESLVIANLEKRGYTIEERRPPPPQFNHRQRILNIFIGSNKNFDCVPHVRQLDWGLTRAYEAMYRGTAAPPDDGLLDAAREIMHIDDVVTHEDLVAIGEAKDANNRAEVDIYAPGATAQLANITKEVLDLRNANKHDHTSYVVRPKLPKIVNSMVIDKSTKSDKEDTSGYDLRYASMTPYERLAKLTRSVVLPITDRGENCQLSPAFTITNVVIRSTADKGSCDWYDRQLKFVSGKTMPPPKGSYVEDSCISLCEHRLDQDDLTRAADMERNLPSETAATHISVQAPDTHRRSVLSQKPYHVGDVTLELLLAHDVVFVCNTMLDYPIPPTLRDLLELYLAKGGSVVLDGSVKGLSLLGYTEQPYKKGVFDRSKPGNLVPPLVRLPLNRRLFSNRVNPAAIVHPAVSEHFDHFSHVREVSKMVSTHNNNAEERRWRSLLVRPITFRPGMHLQVDVTWNSINSERTLHGYVHETESTSPHLTNTCSCEISTYHLEVPIYRDAAAALWVGRKPVRSPFVAQFESIMQTVETNPLQRTVKLFVAGAAATGYNLLPAVYRTDNRDAYMEAYETEWRRAFLNEDNMRESHSPPSDARCERALQVNSPIKTALEMANGGGEAKDSAEGKELIPRAIATTSQCEAIAEAIIPKSATVARRKRIGTLGITPIRFVPASLTLAGAWERPVLNPDYLTIHKSRVQRALTTTDPLYALNDTVVERCSILLNMLLSAASQSSIRRPDDTSLAPGQHSRFVPIDTAIRRRGQLFEDAETARKLRLAQHDR